MDLLDDRGFHPLTHSAAHPAAGQTPVRRRAEKMGTSFAFTSRTQFPVTLTPPLERGRRCLSAFFRSLRHFVKPRFFNKARPRAVPSSGSMGLLASATF